MAGLGQRNFDELGARSDEMGVLDDEMNRNQAASAADIKELLETNCRIIGNKLSYYWKQIAVIDVIDP